MAFLLPRSDHEQTDKAVGSRFSAVFSLPSSERQVLGADLNCSESSWGGQPQHLPPDRWFRLWWGCPRHPTEPLPHARVPACHGCKKTEKHEDSRRFRVRVEKPG